MTPPAPGTIATLPASRPAGRTICPSEVARALVGPGGDWRAPMGPDRGVAAALAASGQIRITQRGRDVAPGVRGPIRLARQSG